MTREQDYARFVELMKWAGDMTTIPNEKRVGSIAFAMFDELKQYPFEAVALAVRAHCRSDRFFPTLADIVQHIEGTDEDQAAAAWAMVLKAMPKWGYYDSVRFPDPAIHYAISQMGGWARLCATMTDETEPFRKKDFAGYYAMGKKVKNGIPPYLAGQHEAENRMHGKALVSPVWDVATGHRIQTELPAMTSSTTSEIVQILKSRMTA